MLIITLHQQGFHRVMATRAANRAYSIRCSGTLNSGMLLPFSIENILPGIIHFHGVADDAGDDGDVCKQITGILPVNADTTLNVNCEPGNLI